MPFQCEPEAADAVRPAVSPRAMFTLFAVNFAATASNALVSTTLVRDGRAGVTATSHVVPTGKTLVLLALIVSVKNVAAAAQGVQVHVRYRFNAALSGSEPPVASCAAGTKVGIANMVDGNMQRLTAGWPTQYEIIGSGDAQFGITAIGTATAGNDVFLVGYEY